MDSVSPAMEATEPVDVDEHPIAWRETGPADAPVVLFLHGLGGGRTAWDPQLAALSSEFRCVAWDMPGYGASAPVGPDATLSFATIVDALVGLLDRLGVQRAHLVGLSYGGMHAQHLALAHPDRVASLTLTDTSPAFGLDGTDRDEWIASRLAPLAAGGSLAAIAPAVVTAIAAPGFAGPEFDASVAAFGRIGDDAFAAACRALPDHDVRDRLHEITAPTLVVVGSADTETPPSYARFLADGIAGARLEIIDGAGHLAPAEDPATFNRLLAAFLDETERTERGQTPATATRPGGTP
jgi:3-oxoadipate enol-lactonase